jgi:hypothetical protein
VVPGSSLGHSNTSLISQITNQVIYVERSAVNPRSVRVVKNFFDMTGKTVLVTGGSRRLGRGLAQGFAGAGANLAIVSRKLDNCETVAREIEQLGVRALPFACPMGRWYSRQSGAPSGGSTWWSTTPACRPPIRRHRVHPRVSEHDHRRSLRNRRLATLV